MAKDRKGELYTLPTGIEAEIDGMTGHEEDLLANEKLVKSGKAIEGILKGCILKLDGKKPSSADIANMVAPDRRTALLRLRELTYGPEVEVEVQCGCKHTTHTTVRLDQLENRPMPEDMDTIDIQGTTVTLRFLQGKDEQKIAKEDNDRITVAMLLQIEEIEGVHRNGYRQWLKDLPSRERLKLRRALEGRDCGIMSSRVEVECDNCGKANTVAVEGQSGFFFPQNEME